MQHVKEKTSKPTLNRCGHTSDELNEVSAAFVDFCRTTDIPVLDIGAAFGVASLAALAVGATVVANDIDANHLEVLRQSTAEHDAKRLTTVNGRFPDELEFAECSFSAIHASNLLNFLNGSEITIGLRKMYRWLRPCGKVFTISGTPYAANVRGFIPVFEGRMRRGEEWPGIAENLQLYSDDPTLLELPETLHLLDAATLERAFRQAGFTIDVAEMFGRDGLPAYLRFDGRENVRVIATKPPR